LAIAWPLLFCAIDCKLDDVLRIKARSTIDRSAHRRPPGFTFLG